MKETLLSAVALCDIRTAGNKRKTQQKRSQAQRDECGGHNFAFGDTLASEAHDSGDRIQGCLGVRTGKPAT